MKARLEEADCLRERCLEERLVELEFSHAMEATANKALDAADNTESSLRYEIEQRVRAEAKLERAQAKLTKMSEFVTFCKEYLSFHSYGKSNQLDEVKEDFDDDLAHTLASLPSSDATGALQVQIDEACSRALVFKTRAIDLEIKRLKCVRKTRLAEIVGSSEETAAATSEESYYAALEAGMFGVP